MILRNKNGAGQIMLPDYRQYYKAIVIRIVWYCHTHTQKRCIDQRHRLESPERSLQIYGQLVDDKRGKNIQWRQDSLLSKW